MWRSSRWVKIRKRYAVCWHLSVGWAEIHSSPALLGRRTGSWTCITFSSPHNVIWTSVNTFAEWPTKNVNSDAQFFFLPLFFFPSFFFLSPENIARRDRGRARMWEVGKCYATSLMVWCVRWFLSSSARSSPLFPEKEETQNRRKSPRSWCTCI